MLKNECSINLRLNLFSGSGPRVSFSIKLFSCKFKAKWLIGYLKIFRQSEHPSLVRFDLLGTMI